jgi:hypothetical protein
VLLSFYHHSVVRCRLLLFIIVFSVGGSCLLLVVGVSCSCQVLNIDSLGTLWLVVVSYQLLGVGC